LFLKGLTSAKGLVLPEKINGCLFLNGLTSAEGLVLPDNFDLNKLHCPNYIKEEIYNNLDKYYQKEETDDYKLVKKIEMIYI
jgi:predicted nucleic acid-binding protein